MFSVKWDKKPDDFNFSGRKGNIVHGENKNMVCRIETWAFSSCACFALSRFNDAWHFKFTDENVDGFFKYLCTLDEDWQPKEFYFMLSTSQLESVRFKALYKHPDVKLRDVFKNKSHNPNKVYLFRYSSKKDFQRLQLPKGA
jgi:hypothetical protein